MSEPTLEESLVVAHSPEQVWALISDLTQMPRWSPQVRKTVVSGGSTRLGATMINFNRRGPLWWPTRAKVVAYEAPRHLAFRIAENATVWSFTLEPTDGGTRIIERRDAPSGISKLSLVLQKYALGGRPQFETELRQGMQETLQRIAADLH